jgi:cytosine/adenosine deaminase-related metal-dependent hydrolase
MTEVKTIVRAGRVVPAHDKPSIPDGAVAVAEEKIAAVGGFKELSAKYPNAEVIGGEDFLLIPGLINGHGHGRGLTDYQRGALDNTLESWLFDTRKYVPVSTYDDLALSAIRLLKCGVTTTMHNHILKNPAEFEQEFDEGLKAYRDSGIRVQFNPGVRNDNPFVYGDNAAFLNDLPGEMRKALTAPPPSGSLTAENFVEEVNSLHDRCNTDMSRIGFGPLAPQWCTDALLLEIRKAAEKLSAPVHVHAVQSIFQKIYGLEFLGKSLVRHMHDIGFLGKGVVIGHCVWPTEDDVELLAASGTAVTHHPSCNLRVRNGISPAFHMLGAGVLVGLGLDGKSINDDDDMIQEMKVCYLLHRLPSLELESDHMTSRQVFQMATENNAVLLGYEGQLGRLEPGRLADMALIDYNAMAHPYVDPSHDPIDTLLYRGSGRFVHTVLVNGRVAVKEGRVLTIDEEAVCQRLAEAASQPRTEKEEAMLRAMDTLKAHVKNYYEGWPRKVDVEPYFMTNSRTDGIKA